MSRKNKVCIMDVFGHLTRPAKRPRRKRCAVCNELTHSTLWMSYSKPWEKKHIDGIHCEKCTEEHNNTWQKELDAWLAQQA